MVLLDITNPIGLLLTCSDKKVSGGKVLNNFAEMKSDKIYWQRRDLETKQGKDPTLRNKYVIDKNIRL